MKFYQNNNQLLDAFNAKKIDGFGGINPKNLNNLKLTNQVLEKNMPRYYAIFINKNTNVALKEDFVLTALQLATDKEKIIRLVQWYVFHPDVDQKKIVMIIDAKVGPSYSAILSVTIPRPVSRAGASAAGWARQMTTNRPGL